MKNVHFGLKSSLIRFPSVHWAASDTFAIINRLLTSPLRISMNSDECVGYHCQKSELLDSLFPYLLFLCFLFNLVAWILVGTQLYQHAINYTIPLLQDKIVSNSFVSEIQWFF